MIREAVDLGFSCREACESAHRMSTLTVCRRRPLAVVVLAGLTMNLRESDAGPAASGATSVSRGDMLNWLADGQKGLWIQAGNSKWFYARFLNICPGLQSTNSLVFETGVQTLVPSNGPPKNRNAGVLLQPQTQCVKPDSLLM